MSACDGCGDHCHVQYICYGAAGDSQRQVVFAVAGGDFQGYGAGAAGASIIVSL